MSYDIKKSCVLIVKDGCSACQQVTSLIFDHIEDNKILLYTVFQSRIKNMWEIRPLGEDIEGLPKLFSSDQINEVPILYDPVLDEMLIGAEDIEEYLEHTGLI